MKQEVRVGHPPESRITSGAGVSFVYNGDGERVQKSDGTTYWGGGAGSALLETDNSGNPKAEYIFFNGKRLARRDLPGGSVKLYFADNLGSASVISDTSGNLLESYDYAPYGELHATSGSDSNHYLFGGKERDSETGLDYFGARYYGNALGRWMSPDWAAKPTSVPYASFGDPQTLNLYAYVANRPIVHMDADGHVEEPKGVTKPIYQGNKPTSNENPECQGGTCNPNAAAAARTQADLRNKAQQQGLSPAAEQAILNSNLSGPQAIAFETAVNSAGKQYGVDPNVLVGMAGQESTFNPAAQSSTSTANGLFGLTAGVRSQYGLSNDDATGTSASAITNQVTTAAHYLGDLKNGPVPKSHPEHSLEIAIGYYRGSRKGVNGAINSKGGYDSMLKLSYGGETLGHYINSVERYVP